MADSTNIEEPVFIDYEDQAKQRIAAFERFVQADPVKAATASATAEQVFLDYDTVYATPRETLDQELRRAAAQQTFNAHPEVFDWAAKNPQDADQAADDGESLGLIAGIAKFWTDNNEAVEHGFKAGRRTSEQGGIWTAAKEQQGGELTPEQAARDREIEEQLKRYDEKHEGNWLYSASKFLGTMAGGVETLSPLEVAGAAAGVGLLMMAAPAAGVAAGGAAGLVGAATTMAGSAGAATALVGATTTFAALRSSYIVEGGLAYREMMVDAKADKNAAMWCSAGVGFLNSALEVAPIARAATVIGKPVIAIAQRTIKDLAKKEAATASKFTWGMLASSVLRTWGEGMAFEPVTEVGQELSTAIGTELAKIMSSGEYKSITGEELGRRLWDTYIETLKGMAILGFMGSLPTAAHGSMKLRDAQRNKKFFEDIAAAGKDSKLKARAPTAFGRFVESMVPQEKKTLYVDASALQQAATESGATDEELRSILGDEAVADMKVEGSVKSIEIPLSTYAARISGTKFDDALQPHLRTEQDGKTFAQAVAASQEQAELMALAREGLGGEFTPKTPEELAAMTPLQQRFYQQAADRNEVLQKNVRALTYGRDTLSKDFDAKAINDNAVYLTAFEERMARRLGKSVQEVHNVLGPQIAFSADVSQGADGVRFDTPVDVSGGIGGMQNVWQAVRGEAVDGEAAEITQLRGLYQSMPEEARPIVESFLSALMPTQAGAPTEAVSAALASAPENVRQLMQQVASPNSAVSLNALHDLWNLVPENLRTAVEAALPQDVRDALTTTREQLDRREAFARQKQYAQQAAQIQSEMEEVRKQYEGSGQWMKAPNGQPTNLTEQQWLQVRTPSFKAWFGDWEARAGFSEADAMNAIEIDQQLAGLEGSELRAKAKSLYKELFVNEEHPNGTLITNRFGDPVLVNMRGYLELKHHSANPLTLRIIPQLEELIAKAAYLGRDTLSKENAHKRDDTKGFSYYIAKANIDGEPYYVRIVVREYVNGTRFYDAENTLITKIKNDRQNLSSGIPRTERGASSTSSAATHSLAYWYQKAASSSKVVDENGEPKVVYHGDSRSDITEFSTDGLGHTQGTGAWFTSSAEAASTYGGTVYPVFLYIRNLKTVDAAGQGNAEIRRDIVVDRDGNALREFSNYDDADEYVRKTLGDEEFETYDIDTRWQDTDALAREARESGENDGLLIRNVRDTGDIDTDVVADDYVVFDPTHIKSAVANNGEFSAETPNIYKQIESVRRQYEGSDQWMKAPNGNPTNLTEQQWLQVRTPSFKAWFGDWEANPAAASKVVDENGEPKVMYHGTRANFSEFRAKYPDGLFFFTTNREMADRWSRGRQPTAELEGRIAEARRQAGEHGEALAAEYGDSLDERYDEFRQEQDAWERENLGLDGMTVAEAQFNLGAKVMPVFINSRNVFDPSADWGESAPVIRRRMEEVGASEEDARNGHWAIWESKDVIDSVMQDHDSILLSEDGDGNFETIAIRNSVQVKSAIENNGDFDPANPNIYMQVNAPVNAGRVFHREPGNFTPEEQAAFDAYMDSRADKERILANLEKHKGSGWAKQAIEAAFVRQAIRETAEGRTPAFESSLDSPVMSVFKNQLKREGWAALKNYAAQKGLIGNAAKPVNNVNSSFLNCNPSPDCAVFCYATKGNYRYSNVIVKSEIVTMLVETDPEWVAERVASQYKGTAEFSNNKALRLFDKGDGDAAWLPVIEGLNKRGVRVQIFSKRPEFLRQVSDFNLRLLSIDASNIELADRNPDLPIAFVYGGEKQTADVARLADRIQVVLPVKQGRKLLNIAKTKALMKAVPAIRPHICPIDAGFKPLGKTGETKDGKGVWNCTMCDTNGGVGCYFGKSTKAMQEAAVKADSFNEAQTRRNIEKRRQELAQEIKRLKELMNDGLKALTAGVAQDEQGVRRGSDLDSEFLGRVQAELGPDAGAERHVSDGLARVSAALDERIRELLASYDAPAEGGSTDAFGRVFEGEPGVGQGGDAGSVGASRRIIPIYPAEGYRGNIPSDGGTGGGRVAPVPVPESEVDAVRRKYAGSKQWMKAPNGKPTKLTEQQWLQVRTPSFKKWFGDWENDAGHSSRIVDENGEPQVMWHQTKATDIQVFDTNRRRGNGSHDTETPHGVFLKPENNDIGLPGNVQMPLFTNIRNPISFRDRHEIRRYFDRNIPGYKALREEFSRKTDELNELYERQEEAAASYINRYLEERGVRSIDLSDEEREAMVDAAYADSDKTYKKLRRYENDTTRKLKKMVDDHFAESGHDGVLIERDEGGGGRVANTTIALRNNQVKSATKNSGAFSLSNPNIYQQRVWTPQPAFTPDDALTNSAVMNFGITSDPSEAGYILPDGRMLDFSGRHWGGGDGGSRLVEHNDVGEVEGIEGGGTDAMVEFMSRTGAMRVDLNAAVASAVQAPTREQLGVLSRFTRGNPLALSFLTNDGRIVTDTELERSNAASIRSFFEEAQAQRDRGEVSGAYAQRVYHGSPFQFERFDLGHIGEGEGAQAHGWGLYFAGDIDIASMYWQVLTRGAKIDSVYTVTIGGKEYNLNDAPPNAEMGVVWDFLKSEIKWRTEHGEGSVGKTEIFPEDKLEYWLDRELYKNRQSVETLESEKPTGIEEIDEIHNSLLSIMREKVALQEAVLEKAKAGQIKMRLFADSSTNGVGRVYEVEVPDSSTMLDEDLPLDEQPERVQAILKEAGLFTRMDEARMQELNNRTAEAYRRSYAAYEAAEAARKEWYAIADDEEAQGSPGWRDQVSAARERFNQAEAENKRLDAEYTRIRDEVRDELRGIMSARSGRDFYRLLSEKLGSPKAASELLLGIGIHGIAYEGGRDGRCYVIFDDADVQITRYWQNSEYTFASVHTLLVNGREVTADTPRDAVLRDLGNILIDPYGDEAETGSVWGMSEEHVLTGVDELREQYAERLEDLDGEEADALLEKVSELDRIRTEVEEGTLEFGGWAKPTAMRQEVREPVPPRAPQYQGPNGMFDPGQNVIVLTPGANLSTFCHEVGHWYLETLMSLAENSPDPTMREDAQTLLRAFGLDSLDEWRSLDPSAKERFHEQFAAWTEEYMSSGKAPTPSLKRLFARFQSWITTVYRDLFVHRQLNARHSSVFGEELPELSDEVRRVLDRALASDEEMRLLEAQDAPQSLFEKKPDGVSDEEWAEYQKLQEEKHNEGRTELDKAIRRRIAYQTADDARRLRAEAKREATERIAGEGTVFNKLLQITKLNSAFKFSPESLEGILTPEEITKLKQKRIVAGRGNGLPISDMKANWGIDDVAVFLRAALTFREEMEEQIRAETDRIMNERYSDYATEEAIAQTAAKALATERADIVGALEVAFIDRMAAPDRRGNALARRQAESEGTEGDNFQTLMRKYKKADAELRQALRVRDIAAATEAKRERDKAKAKMDVLARSQRNAAAVSRAELTNARTVAESLLGQTQIGKLTPQRYLSAAQKAGREAMEALAKGDIAGAKDAKRKQLVYQIMARRAVDIQQKEIGKLRKIAERARAADEKTAKTRNMDFVNLVRIILGRYGLLSETRLEKAEDVLKRIREYDPDSAFTLENMLTVLGEPKEEGDTYRDLTYDDFKVLSQQAEGVWKLSRGVKEADLNGEKVKMDEVRQKLLEQLEWREGKPKTGGRRRATNERDKERFSLLRLSAGLRRVEEWCRDMDLDNPDMPFTKYIWSPVKAGCDAYRLRMKEVGRRITGLFDAYSKTAKKYDGEIVATELVTYGESGIEDAEPWVFATKAELLGALLHTGNASNKQKLLGGYCWGPIVELNGARAVDTRPWDAFIQRMVREGVLTKEDFDLVQSLWDVMAEIKPETQKAFHEMTGMYFDEITNAPFTITFPDGKTVRYEGGYCPAQVDYTRPEAMAHLADEERMLKDIGQTYSVPTTGLGFTKSRVDGWNKPLVLDINLVAQHCDEALRAAYIEPAARKVYRLLMDRDFAAKFRQYGNQNWLDAMIVPWLSRAVSQRVTAPAEGAAEQWFGGLISQLKTRSGLMIMAGNLGNAVEELSGFAVGMRLVSPKRIAKAWIAYKTRGLTAEDVMSKSAYMRQRLNDEGLYDLERATRQVKLHDSALAKAQRFGAQHGYILQQVFQRIVDVPVWQAAYEQEIERGATEEEAIRRADDVIESSMGANTAESLSAAEAGGPLWRALMMFYGYFNMQGNAMVTDIRGALRTGRYGRALWSYLTVMLMPQIISDQIARAIGSKVGMDNDDDDDDDSVMIGILRYLGLQSWNSLTNTIPVAGKYLQRGGEELMGEKTWGGGVNLTPVISTASTVTYEPFVSGKRALVDGKGYRKAVRDALTALSFWTRIPFAQLLGRPLGYAAQVYEGKANDDDAVDVVRGVISGKSPNPNYH